MAVDDKNIVDLLDWYQGVYARRVDLVGDYAGSELFLIDLDSLLLYVFADPLLDFGAGFQLIQAVHAVELFLHQLQKRKCHFSLVSFHQHRDLCIPPNADPANAFKYQLARMIITQHLKRNSRIQVDVFKRPQDPAFHRHMITLGAYFLMAHDGSHALDTATDSDAQGRDREKRARLRRSILSCMSNGYAVALINGIELRDTKVLTMILEAKVQKAKHMKALCEADVPVPEEENVSASAQPVPFVPSLDASHTASTMLAISVLKNLKQAENHDPYLYASLLIHRWLIQNIPLSSRQISDVAPSDSFAAFLQSFSRAAIDVLGSEAWEKQLAGQNAPFDIADLIDGRLFSSVVASPARIYGFLKDNFDDFVAQVQPLWSSIGLDESLEQAVSAAAAQDSGFAQSQAEDISRASPDLEAALLPFSNDVFDSHLERVRVVVQKDESLAEDTGGIFRELTHWHNTNLLAQIPRKKPETLAEQRAASKAMKRNQLRMRDMSTYAASLTNSAGRVLEPESVFVQTEAELRASQKESKSSKSAASGKSGKPPPNKKGAAKPSGASAIKAANAEKMAETANAKALQAWDTVLKRIEKESKDPKRRYLEVNKYVRGLAQEKADIMETEAMFYQLMQLLQLCTKVPYSANTTHRNFHVAAMVWDHVNKLKSLQLSETDVKNLELVSKAMGFPPLNVKASLTAARKSAFKFVVPAADEVKVDDILEFQMSHCGPFFDRAIEAEADPRVRFRPDKWQRQVLDLIDERKSALVVAPTSAGKTFISFYAMKKVLQEDNEGVLVYVAPTKALVNQISAEIQANFNKTYPHAGISVWALHTRDYRINEPVKCQVLVTVPHVLQIMLLSPSNATKFSSKIKFILFDEVHSIGQAEDGLVWEQLLLLAPCPIVALSATVGNADQFADWLKETTENATGKPLAMIRHSTRYNDLRKYVYVPPATKAFTGLTPPSTFNPLGIDGSKQFPIIHPVISLINKSRGMPEDLNLEPRDCLQLWQIMKKVSNEKYPLPKDIDPAKAIPKTVRKLDVIRWEAKLKEVLRSWMNDPSSPFDKVHKELYDIFLRDAKHATGDGQPLEEAIPDDMPKLISTILPLLDELNSRDALPALVFNYDRTACEKICTKILSQLEEAEKAHKETSSSWKRKLAEHEEYVKKIERSQKASKKASTSKDKGSVEEGASKADMLADSAQSQGDKGAIGYFRPEDPLDEFSFADKKKATPSEVDAFIRKLQWSNLPPTLIKALTRGIGVHHAGMNLRYRQCVEMLFRKGYLRVVIATGTLALGINMPCKTVIFAGDSVFLTALNFRQAAGRAGRRGFDLLGNVVFHGVGLDKVFRLISSRLPDLNGHFPITTTLVLRLFHLLNGSKQSKFAKSAINALLSQPRLYLGGDDFKEQVLHHLRFSIEYLRRQKLLDFNGAPINFAGCIMHLYYTESSSFAFHALLKSGFFHRLAAPLDSKTEERIMLELMLVMSHIFGRRPCRRAELEDGYYEKRIHQSPSRVFLDPLPQEAEQILRDHNDEVKHIFKAYVHTFAEQHLEEKTDNVLPLSNMAIGGKAISDKTAREVLHAQEPNKIRSAFTSLSGHKDDFSTIHELCTTTRDGVFLEEAVIPHIPIYPSETTDPLNAYLLDFYKHGDLRAIEEANGIRKGDIWFLLNDFSLVVATIVTALKNYMNLAQSDMLDVGGRGDAQEDEMDDSLVEKMVLEQVSANAAAQDAKAAQAAAAAPKKKKVADSWDDEEEEDFGGITKGVGSMRVDDTEGPEAEKGFDMREGAGLLKVLRAFERLKVTFDERFRATWS